MTCCAWILILLCTALLYFKVALTSDTLIYQDLFDDLFRYGGHWSDWRLNADPDYFPDLFLYFIAYWLFKTPTACLFFVTMIQAILVGLSGLWLATKIRPMISSEAKIVLLLSVAFTSLVASNSHMEIYYNYSNTHVSSFLCTLLSLGLLISYLEIGKRATLILLCILCAIGIVDDPLFLVSFYATALVLLSSLTIAACFYPVLHTYRTRFLWSIVSVAVSYPMAAVLNSLITFNNPLAQRIPLTPDAFINALNIFENSICNLFFPFNLLIFLFTSLIILGLVHLSFLFFRQLRFVPQSRKWFVNVLFPPIHASSFAFAAAFLALLIPINLSAIIVSGGNMDVWGYRYLMFPIALVMLMTIINLDRIQAFVLKSTFFLKCLMLALLIGSGITLLTDLHLLPKTIELTVPPLGFAAGLESERDVPQLVTCLKQIEQSGVKLNSGFALNNSYGRGIAMQLSKKTYISFIQFSPSFWMANIGLYLHPQHYHINYNFIIVSPFGFAPPITIWQTPFIRVNTLFYNVAKAFYPTGYKRFSCANTNTEIWVYPDTRLNDFIQPIIDITLFAKGKIKEISWYASDLFGDIGKKQGSERIAQPPDQAGYVLYNRATGEHFGEFNTASYTPGKYRVTIYYSAENKQDNEPIGRWYIAKTIYPLKPVQKDLIVYDGLLPAAKNGMVSVEFTIPSKGIKTNQVLVWYSGHGQLILKKMVIERLSPLI